MKLHHSLLPILLSILSMVVFLIGLRSHGPWHVAWEFSGATMFPFIGGPLMVAGYCFGEKKYASYFLYGLIFALSFSTSFTLNAIGAIGEDSYLLLLAFSVAVLLFASFKRIAKQKSDL